MSNIATISELLSLSGSQYRIYDLGRKIEKLSKEQFNKIELNQLPYPTPSQGNAEFAIAFWQKQTSQPFIWFVKLPLDERSLINQGARNHFIAIIIEALGNELSGEITKKQEELLSANPYHFTPAPYKLAGLNSILNHSLSLPASQHYEPCRLYFHGNNNYQQWQTLGLQGINDFCARLDEGDNANCLVKALPNLPKEVLEPLASALENYVLPLPIIEAILAKIVLERENSQVYPHYLLRALASSVKHPLVSKHISGLLAADTTTSEILIVIASRCWSILEQDAHAMQFLEKMANIESTEFFNAIFKDLIAIPLIRPILLRSIRNTERSDQLAKAIGLLFRAQ